MGTASSANAAAVGALADTLLDVSVRLAGDHAAVLRGGAGAARRGVFFDDRVFLPRRVAFAAMAWGGSLLVCVSLDCPTQVRCPQCRVDFRPGPKAGAARQCGRARA